MKLCSVCKTTKPLEEFHRDKSKRDGRMSHCRKCSRDAVGLTAVKVRKRVKQAIQVLAEHYGVSQSQAVEMCILDAMLEENLAVTDWGGRLRPAVQIERRKLHPVTGEPLPVRVRKNEGRVYVETNRAKG
jgi:hypothetical protein